MQVFTEICAVICLMIGPLLYLFIYGFHGKYYFDCRVKTRRSNSLKDEAYVKNSDVRPNALVTSQRRRSVKKTLAEGDPAIAPSD